MYNNCSIFIFFMFYTLGLLTNNPNYAVVGKIFTFASLGSLLLMFLLKNKFIFDKKVSLLFLLMFLYPFFSSFYYGAYYGSLNSKYIYINFQFLLIFLVFFVGYQYKNNDYVINLSIKICLLILLLLIPVFGNGSIVGKQNIFASLVLILMSFILFAERNFLIKIIFVLISLFMITYADARSSLMASVMMLLIYIFYRPLIKFKGLIFSLSFLIAFSWIFVIVYLYTTGTGDALNQYVYDVFDKRLYSGRERMWGEFFASISMAPIFGHGLGMNYNILSNEDYSTHNVYLATLLQQGLFGLIILLSTLWLVYNNSIANANINKSKSLAFILIPPILLQQNFELSMTQNNMSFMIIFWFLLGVSIKNKPKNLSIEKV